MKLARKLGTWGMLPVLVLAFVRCSSDESARAPSPAPSGDPNEATTDGGSPRDESDGEAPGSGDGGPLGTDGGGLSGSDGGTAPKPHFPRLGAYPIGGDHAYDAPAFRDIASKYHVVIVSQWPGWQGSGMSMADVMKDIKAKSVVGTKLFVYVVNNEASPTLPKNDAYYPVWQKLEQEHWWLYPSGSSGKPVTSTYPGKAIVNNTNFGKKDANGKNWIEWKADFDFGFVVTGNADNAPNAYVDGFFMDNVLWTPRVDGDWNLDGKIDSQSSPAVRKQRREGYKHYFDYIRSIWPNSIQIGNIADWGQADAVLDPLDQVLEGGVMESMIGMDYSFETWGGFDVMMAAYRKMIDACRDPKLVIFAQDNLSNTDYRGMRYGLASTLMDDGYYYVNGAEYGTDLKWFDEFEFDLGDAMEPRREKAWQNGVWRREFEHGIVLVNPKGNGKKTVSLGGTFRKLAGKQDPTTNDGSTVTEVTLADRDGLVLRR